MMATATDRVPLMLLVSISAAFFQGFNAWTIGLGRLRENGVSEHRFSLLKNGSLPQRQEIPQGPRLSAYCASTSPRREKRDESVRKMRSSGWAWRCRYLTNRNRRSEGDMTLN